ncbi:hypothetical protein R84B8_02074 [Treponema sp. R8-4-B8]
MDKMIKKSMRAIFFLFFIVFSYSVFADDQNDKTDYSEKGNLKQSFYEIQTQIDKLNQKYFELLDEIKNTNISNYSNIFSHWLNIQQILIGLLAGLSLLLPLLTYLFGYKPAKDAEERLRTLEINFEKVVKERLEKYIKDKEINDMKTAINNLSSNNQELKTQAINYINYNPNVQIDDIERKKVYEMLIDPNVSEQIKIPLGLVLTNKKSIWADLYFDIISNNESIFKKNFFYITKYLLLYGYQYKKDIIISLLQKSDDKTSFLYYFVISPSLVFSDSLIKEIINDKDTLSLLTESEKNKFCNQIKEAEKQYNLKIQDSELYKILNV